MSFDDGIAVTASSHLMTNQRTYGLAGDRWSLDDRGGPGYHDVLIWAMQHNPINFTAKQNFNVLGIVWTLWSKSSNELAIQDGNSLESTKTKR